MITDITISMHIFSPCTVLRTEAADETLSPRKASKANLNQSMRERLKEKMRAAKVLCYPGDIPCLMITRYV